MKSSRLATTLGLCLICSAAFAARPSVTSVVSPVVTADVHSGPQAFIRLAALEFVGGGTEGDEEKAPEPQEEPAKEDFVAPATPVTFTGPLTTGGKAVEGLTLEQLIEGSPLFPPIDGLPAALWEGKACTTCHQWSREDLCEQGTRYLPDSAAEFLEKQHPYGGGFKRNVKAWAENDCK